MATTLLVMPGCQSSSATPKLEDLFKNTKHATTVKLSVPANDIALPVVRTLAIDKYLVIQSIMNSDNLFVYDLEKQNLEHTLFKTGRGPRELVHINGVAGFKEGLIIYSNGQIIMTNSLEKGSEKDIVKIDQPNGVNLLTSLVPINDDYIVAIGQYDESNKQFALLDRNFSVVNYFEDYPLSSGDTNTLSYGLQGKITPNGSGKFVYTSNFGNIVRFFELSGSQVTKLEEYLIDIPKFVNVGSGDMQTVAQSSDNINGNISVAASKDRYYMLYSDNTIAQRGGRSSNVIYVYENDGDPDTKIQLDREVEHIVYSHYTNKLYAIALDGDDYFIFEIQL